MNAHPEPAKDLPLASSVKAHYRASGYRAEDVAVLVEDLRAIGPTRARPLYMPEAGGSTELWLALEWIGQTVAAGAAFELIRAAALRVKAWWEKKANRHEIPPEVSGFKLGFDDVQLGFVSHDLEDPFDYLTGRSLLYIAEGTDLMRDVFTARVIHEHEIQLILVRLPPDLEGDPEFLVGKRAPFVTHRYERETRSFTPHDMPGRRWAPEFDGWD